MPKARQHPWIVPCSGEEDVKIIIFKTSDGFLAVPTFPGQIITCIVNGRVYTFDRRSEQAGDLDFPAPRC